jgi:DNA-binding IclR family transcriptional regulator
MAGSDLVQSLLKGLDILVLAGESGGGVRLADICEQQGLKASTAHNLVRTLTARGFLAKTEGGRYIPGSAIDELVRRKGESRLMQRAKSAVRRLAGNLPEATVTFAVAEGGDIVVALRMCPDQPGTLQQNRERTFNLYANASGLVLQAFGSDAQLSALRHRYPFHEYGALLWHTEERLRGYLDEVKRRGFAERPFAEKEIFRVAAPVWTTGVRKTVGRSNGNNTAGLAGTLGISIPEGAIRPDVIVRSLLDGSGEIGSMDETLEDTGAVRRPARMN